MEEKKQEMPLFVQKLEQIKKLNCEMNDCIIDIHNRLNAVDKFSINSSEPQNGLIDKKELTGIECYNEQVSFMASNLEKLEIIRSQVYKLF